jgi:hypothetical protein
MIQPGNNRPTNAWYRLTPDATGSYAKGAWSALAPMSEQRFVFASAVLPDGRVFVLGGAQSVPDPFTNTAEIFDPAAGAAGAWESVAPVPTPKTGVHLPPGSTTSQWGEDPIEVVANGNVLAGYFSGPTTYLYNPAKNSWTTTAHMKLRQDSSSEEAWVKLPDNSILSYDVQSSLATGVFHAQRYFWNTQQWVDASNVSGTNPPQLLSSRIVGLDDNGFLLPDRRVMFLGGNGNTAFYKPLSNTWSAGPKLPSKVINGVTKQLGATDNPGAMLPNGDILIALSPIGPIVNGGDTFPPPTFVFEFNPISQVFTDVTPPGLTAENAVSFTMLVLPTGQVLLANSSGRLQQIYTPSGLPQDAWRPTILAVQPSAGGGFTLSGTQLNGISEGANAGDDWLMASNYPIVQLQDSSGHVFYARTFDWSSTGLATGNIVKTVNFQLPAGLPTGNYNLSVIANGIASHPIPFASPGRGILSGQLVADTSRTGSQSPPGFPGQASLHLMITSGGSLSGPDVRGVHSAVVAGELTIPISLNGQRTAAAGERNLGSHGGKIRRVATRSADRLDTLAGFFATFDRHGDDRELGVE